jgi:arylsulfatase A-like enzyme
MESSQGDALWFSFGMTSPARFRSLICLVSGIFFFSGNFLRLAAAEGKKPNLLFLLADDLRPDCLSISGNPLILTPNLDALAARGMRFTRATCSYPICVVSRAEMLTGCHGWENGVDGMRTGGLESDLTFWPEAMRDAGFETWHVGKWHISGRPSQRGYTDVAGLFSGGGSRFWKEGQVDWKGFPLTGYRGWIFQSDDGKTLYPDFGVGLTPDISSHFADAAISLLSRKTEKPWICHVNFTAPHDPLMMPSGMEGKYRASEIPLPLDFLPEHPFDHGNLRGRDEELLAFPRTEEAVRDLLRVYYSVVEDLDRQVGRILTALEESGQLENTVVIFSSDHGMACGSHGLRGKQNQYEHTIDVPLVIAGPGIAPGSVSGAQVYLRELYPTTCEWLGVGVPGSVTARSFAPVLRGEMTSHHEDIFGYYTDTQRMVRTSDGWKLIHYPKAEKWQLFDLNHDPHELANLLEEGQNTDHPRFAELREKLVRWQRETGDPLLK